MGQVISSLVMPKYLVYVMAFVVLVFFAVHMQNSPEPIVFAQEGPNNLKKLLVQLDARTTNEDGFSFTIEFTDALVANQDSITLVRGTTQDELRTTIGEIGSDYFCLNELGGAALFVRCIPFANIASISYLNN